MPEGAVTGLAADSLRAIAGNLRKLAAFCFAVAVAVSIWSLFAKPRYLSTATAIVPGAASTSSIASLAGSLLPGGMSGGLGSLASSIMGGGLSGMPAGVDVYVVERVLSSRPVLERLILKYDLISRFRAPTMGDAMKKLSKRVSITLTTDGFFIIAAQGETREEAAAMVTDIIDFANDELSRQITTRARRARIEAELSLTTATDSLDASQLRMRDFRDSTGLMFPEEQGAGMVQVLGQIEAEMVTARSELYGAAANLAPGSASYRELAARAGLLEEAMAARLGPGDSLSIFPGYSELPDMIRQYETLYIDVEMCTAIVLMLRQQLETLRIEEARDSPTLEVIEPPTPAKLRSFPRRSLMVLKITAAAFVLGCLWLSVLTYLRSVMRHPRQGEFLREIFATASSQLPHRRGPRTERRGD